MTIEPTDIAILLVSMAACIYCFVLNRRLKALQNTKDGLGATIMALSKSIADMSSKTQSTRNQADEIASRLSRVMVEADHMCTRIQDLTQEMEASHNKATEDVTSAQIELGTMLRDVVSQSKDRVHEISELVRQLRVLSKEVATPELRRALQQIEPNTRENRL